MQQPAARNRDGGSLPRRDRRTPYAYSAPTLCHADVELNPVGRRATRGGHLLDLREREFELLEYFLRAPGRILSRERIFQDLWDQPYDGLTNVIDVHVRYLRAKLEQHGERMIVTVRGRGYMLK